MSTVLWANVLIDGKVKSDETDHLALYKHADKLDLITKTLRLPSFTDLCDLTDQKYNADEGAELPEGMTSTDQLMAVQGSWLPTSSAIAMMQSIRDHIVSKNVRFGLLSNQQHVVIAELDEVLAFAKGEAARAEKFNFSVVG